MVNEKELQEKMLIYRTLEARLEAMTKQRDLITSKVVEIVGTLSSIEEIEKNKESIWFKLGSDAYAQGTFAKAGKIFVEIGAGVVLEKTIEEGKRTLNKRKQEMENALKDIQNDVSQISNAMRQLAPEINELIQKSNVTG
jgi:prefoldin alpha subunit